MDETAATFLVWLCNNRKVHIFFLSHFLQWRVKKTPTITLRGVSVCMCEEFQCHRSHIIICFGSQKRPPRTWTGVNERASDQSWSGLQMSTLLLGSGEAHLHNRTQIA